MKITTVFDCRSRFGYQGKFDLITCMLWTLSNFEGTVRELMRTAYSGIESDGHTAQ